MGSDVEHLDEEPPLRYFGAAVLPCAGGSVLLQRKTAGYPVDRYVGRFTVPGGFWSTPEDEGPRATLLRELREELRPGELREEVASQLEFFAGFDYRLGDVAGDDGPFWTRTYVFESRLGGADALRRGWLTEGAARFVSDVSAFGGELCWGHDATLQEWGARRGIRLDPAGDTMEYRLVTRTEPNSYEGIDRTRLRHDPLAAGARSDSLGFSED